MVGGTSGIGHGIAVRLAKAGASVQIVGRNEEAGAAILKEMSATGGGGSHSFAKVDAFLIVSAVAYGASFVAEHPKLDILVLSQGMATIQGRTETAEGIDQKLALHYFGRVAFALALMPALERAQGRVLTVLSAGVHSSFADYRTDPELKTSYSLSNAANAAGFFNDIAVDQLAHEHPGVTFIHAAPGFVATNWGTEMPAWLRLPIRALQIFGRSKEDCAEFMCAPLLAPTSAALPGGGFQLLSAEARPVAATALHAEARDFVWAHTKAVLAERGCPPKS